MTEGTKRPMPRMAVVTSNTLAVMGLRQLLQSIVPVVEIDAYSSMSEFESTDTELYAHFFVALDIVLANRQFFISHQRKTIVLTPSFQETSSLHGFHSLCICQSEPLLIRQLLRLASQGHPGGRNLPPIPTMQPKSVLTDREKEIMVLVVQGYINREIAERLSISLATVVTHRKNVMDKLGLKSVSALTVYAVMNGFVDINSI